jgi:hypothetical protein
MIRLSLAFMLLSAVTVILTSAHRASIHTALQLGLMLAIGVVVGALVMVDRTRGEP